jgi:diguanylate cyclase (GGDEF)-like protein/PAS domain S-box-containing protein
MLAVGGSLAMREPRAGVRGACCLRMRMPTLGFTPSKQDAVPVGVPDFARTMLQRLPGAGTAALILALLLAAAPGPAAGASVREFYFQRLGSEQGLVQQTVTALVQDPQGFVWVGTQGGLHRYDGQRFVAWRHDPRDPEGLPDSFVTALAVDGDTLWIGTYSQYVVRLDLGDGRFRRYRADSPTAAQPGADVEARRQIRALLPQDGRLWVATAAGLERLEPATGSRDIVLRLDESTAAAPWHSLETDGEGALWYGSGAGLYRLGPRGGIERIGPAEPVRDLAMDRQGRLWVARGDGLHRLADSGRDLVRAWPLEGSPMPVQAIVEAPDRHLWLSVPGLGLVRFEPGSGAVAARVQENVAIPGSLHENSITTLMLDRGGMLWAGGSYRGVAVGDPRGARFPYVTNIVDGSTVESSVRSLAQDDQGRIWVGTDPGQLLRLSLPGMRFDDLTHLLPATPGGPAAPRMRVMGFAPAAPDRQWLATTRGLMQLDTRAQRIVPIPMAGLEAPVLRSIARDARGDLWLGTSRLGLLHYRPDTGRWRRVGDQPGAGPTTDRVAVHAVYADSRDRIWFGTGDGLGLVEGRSGRLHRFRHGIEDPRSLAGNLVRAIHEDATGTIWIGSHAGLSRVRERPGGRIDFDNPLAEALPGQVPPTVFTIAESPAGTLWLGTNAGILRYDAASANARGYAIADGLQDIEFNGGAVAHLADGRLAFGGVRGLNLFDPARIADSSHMPPVRLLSARVGAAAQEVRVPWQPGELQVPGDVALLRLRVGALDFSPAANLRYRYRLQGFDRDWIDNGASGEISYTRVPPGDYLLQVQASNSDGLWNPELLEVPVLVQPPAWRTPWAIAGYFLAALLLLGSLGWLWHSRRQRERGYFRQIREREERLKLALWASGEQFWDYDLEAGELHWLRADDSGQAPDIGVRTEVDDDHRIHEEDLPQVRERLRQHLDGTKPVFLSEHRVRHDDGTWTWVRTRGRVVERDAQGRALRVAGTARDITISRRAERERRIASEVLRSMTEAVAVFDRDFRFVGVNPAFARMSGYGEAEVVGRPTSLLDSSQHDPDFYLQMRADLERNGRWSGEMWQQRKDGDEFLCWIQGGVVHDASGQRSHYVAVLSDITDQKRAEQELRYLANYDTLTSLPNRALLSERLSRAIVRARRQGSRIAVLFLDLDRFKDVNDSLGHAAGDRILRAAATRLQDTVGAQHTVARLGGDEFTVVLEDLDAPEDAEKVAREVITAFEAPLEIDENQDVTISPSIGISLYPDNAQVPTDLLKHADTAMYQAKAAGRRTYMRYLESMDVHIRHRATVSGALRKVLDRDELRLVFQPQLSLSQARITGVEALLRWKSAEHGEIPPTQFIPLAEESGLILEIGEWALREACFTLKRWRQHGLDRLSMAVNVSSLQLLRGDLPAVVARVLEETGVPASCLELELTESVIMANAEQTMATLQAFRALGVSLAIDDFGTGYSSLAYLKRLPINTLKIDKEFIGDLTTDPDDAAITSTVITMARSLELTVVAEGVETEAQMQFLREHGCDQVQGYWLSRPLDPHSCLSFIRTWAPTLTSTPAA